MRYALVNEQRSEAQPGLSGECLICGRPTIAKCGEIKIWHWAHRGKLVCDPWWENLSEWHRSWQNMFPIDWHEFTQKDKMGEKHIADVKTDQDWVLEFQYSFIKPQERRARNAFYEKLVWIVNGTRRIRDKMQFFNELHQVRAKVQMQMYLVNLNGCALLREWSGIHAPVFFDFGEEVLWCLLPNGQDIWGYVVAFSRREFIELHNKSVMQERTFEVCLNNLKTIVELLIQMRKQTREQNNLQFLGQHRNLISRPRSRRPVRL